jgi:dTDP-3-amino-3,4,6-trideoxy-alpha-D-glucose transaminase
MQAALAQRGIETLIHYPRPVYRYPPFADFGPAGRTLSDRLADEVLSLPIGPHLGLEQIDAVADAVIEWASP